MTQQQRCELTCAAIHYDFWLAWLLEHHSGIIDVAPLQRYGLTEAQMSRNEQVKGFADYYRFSLTLSSEEAQLLKQNALQQTEPIQVCLLKLTD